MLESHATLLLEIVHHGSRSSLYCGSLCRAGLCSHGLCSHGMGPDYADDKRHPGRCKPHELCVCEITLDTRYWPWRRRIWETYESPKIIALEIVHVGASWNGEKQEHDARAPSQVGQ